MLDQNLTNLDPVNSSDKETFHFIALYKNCIIETCCFFEEYETHFVPTKDDPFSERILFVKTAARPAIRRIKEWKDIKLIRNELLAHAWRSKKDNKFSYTKIFSYNSPRNFTELVILKSYLQIVIGLIEAEFKKELAEVPLYMNSIMPTPIPPSANKDLLERMQVTVSEINDICVQYKKGYKNRYFKIVGEANNHASNLTTPSMNVSSGL